MFFVSKDFKDGTVEVTDTSDFSTETVSLREIQESLRWKAEDIKGISKGGSTVTAYKNVRDLLYSIRLRERLSGKDLTYIFDLGAYVVYLTEAARLILQKVRLDVHEFTIPNFFDGLDESFRNNQSIRKVVIPESVKTIGGECFFNAYNLQEVELQGSIIIGNKAFEGCSSLSKVVGSNNIISVGQCAFKNTVIEDFDFSGLVSKVGNSAFMNTKIHRVKLKGTCYPEFGSFRNCDELEEVDMSELDDNFVDILSYCFAGCLKLSSVKLNNSVKRIGYGAFSGCISLQSMELPKSLYEIEENAFYNCYSLSNLDTSNVEAIGDKAFAYCSLSRLTLSSLKRLSLDAFYSCACIRCVDLSTEEKFLLNICSTPFSKSYRIVFTVKQGTFAEEFCETNGYFYKYV